MSRQTNDSIKEFFNKAKVLIKAVSLKIWAYVKTAKIELIVLFSALILDLLTKFIIDKTMDVGDVSRIIPNFLNFRYVLNFEAAFGQSFGLDKVLGLDGVRIMFLCITVLALGGFAFALYFFRNKGLLPRISLALVIAGAAGNFYDRLFLRAVRDFVEIVFFGLDLPVLGSSFAIFNIADAELVIGIIAFSIYFIFMYKSPKDLLVGPVYRPDYKEEDNLSDKNLKVDEDGTNGG